MTELTIVIPTVGRLQTLSRVLDHLERQRASSASFEVMIVADASEPDSSALATVAQGRSFQARIAQAEKPGASAARNCGWQEAASPLILFLDDDILPEPALVAEHLGWHRDHTEREVGVLGHVRWARELRVTPFMRWLEHGIQFDYPNIQGTEAGWGRFYTANASVKRSLIEAVGGFDEDRLPFGYEDLDLAHRMHDLGFRLLYNRAASAEHLHAMDLGFWRRRMARVATSERRFTAIHPEIRPYFRDLLGDAAGRPPARGRGRLLLRLISRSVPWLGPRVWNSADLYYRQALAPHFLRAWEAAEAERQGDRVEPDLSERDARAP